MRKLLIATIVFLVCAGTMSFKPIIEKRSEKPGGMNASAVLIPVGTEGKKISLLELSTISRPALEKLTGKKMNFTQRLAFKGAQQKLRQGIDDNGIVTNNKLKKVFAGDGSQGFHLGGFALGFLLGVIGVLIAYLINDDKKKTRVKWAWIGLIAWIAILLVAFVI